MTGFARYVVNISAQPRAIGCANLYEGDVSKQSSKGRREASDRKSTSGYGEIDYPPKVKGWLEFRDELVGEDSLSVSQKRCSTCTEQGPWDGSRPCSQ
jgi:hypothetical protein